MLASSSPHLRAPDALGLKRSMNSAQQAASRPQGTRLRSKLMMVRHPRCRVAARQSPRSLSVSPMATGFESANIPVGRARPGAIAVDAHELVRSKDPNIDSPSTPNSGTVCVVTRAAKFGSHSRPLWRRQRPKRTSRATAADQGKIRNARHGTVVTVRMPVAVQRVRGWADWLDERGQKSRTPGVTRRGGCRTCSA